MTQLLHGQDHEEIQVLTQDFKNFVGMIIVLASPLSINALSRLLNRQAREVAYRLNCLHSVLHIPVA